MHLDEVKVLQYFDKVSHNLAVPNAFAEVVKVTNHTGLRCWAQMHLMEFVSMAWSTASESMVLGLPDST